MHIAEPVLAPNESLYSLESIEKHPMSGSVAVIRLKPGVTMREVVDQLNREYTLLGFDELLPTMNEIFIETVTQGDGQK
ncbi:DUF4162 domain-containing protein [uncultured Muribaculum sp.]|uniref:DUF4162 domain-containing protein n=1 Tax=uncultured Muribaculum sp. TaxID=1918613 RepID=UPI0034637117